jgi:hypothetical protein
MKRFICDAFCSALDERQVPAGRAITTPYLNADCDPLLIYFVRDERGRWRIEDDGAQVPLLEACGVDLSGKARGEAFDALLAEYDFELNRHARTLCSAPMPESELGAASLRFMALLLRLQDLALLSPQIVRNTFRDDALKAIHEAFDGSASVVDQEALAPDLVGQEPDVVIRASHATPPVGVYFATSEERALQALVLKMEMDKYRDIATSIILLLEHSKENPVKSPTLGLAMARLDAVVSFRDAKRDTLARIAKTAQIQQRVLVQ